MRELGCEYAILYFPEAAYDRSGIELFEREVMPAVGAEVRRGSRRRPWRQWRDRREAGEARRSTREAAVR